MFVESFIKITKTNVLLAIACTDERIRIRAEMCMTCVNRPDDQLLSVLQTQIKG